jgi:hypothetical protein
MVNVVSSAREKLSQYLYYIVVSLFIARLSKFRNFLCVANEKQHAKVRKSVKPRYLFIPIPLVPANETATYVLQQNR